MGWRRGLLGLGMGCLGRGRGHWMGCFYQSGILGSFRFRGCYRVLCLSLYLYRFVFTALERLVWHEIFTVSPTSNDCNFRPVSFIFHPTYWLQLLNYRISALQPKTKSVISPKPVLRGHNSSNRFDPFETPSRPLRKYNLQNKRANLLLAALQSEPRKPRSAFARA